MKMKVFIDAINNGYARLVSEERAMEQMDVLLTTLARYIPEPLGEGDILELHLSDKQEVINACKLVEETEKRWREAKALHEWMKYGIYSCELDELMKENNV
jgi:hypothetical protein